MRGAVAVDTMLLALAAHPDACRSSGFSTGLLRAAIVASELHPCSPQERVDYDHAAGRAVPTTSTTAVDNARDADGSALPLLSRRAIELLLSARPGGISASVDGLMREVCGTIGVAEIKLFYGRLEKTWIGLQRDSPLVEGENTT